MTEPANEANDPSNEGIVKACWLAYSGFENNQRDDLLGLLAEDVVFDFPPSLPYGGRYVGIAGF